MITLPTLKEESFAVQPKRKFLYFAGISRLNDFRKFHENKLSRMMKF